MRYKLSQCLKQIAVLDSQCSDRIDRSDRTDRNTDQSTRSVLKVLIEIW